MPTSIISGNVNADGTIASGTGFTITNSGDGLYLITFRPSFTAPPAVVLTQNYRSWSDFDYGGGDSRDNCVLVAVNMDHAKVLTGGSSGEHGDRNFCFIAIGPTP